MKNLLSVFILLSFTFTSCQKEIAWSGVDLSNGGGIDSTGGGGNTPVDLLIKVVSESNDETTTTNYTYNAHGALETEKIVGVSAALNIDSYRRFERDATGRIVRVVQKISEINGVPSDTSFLTVHYPDPLTLSYDYTTTTLSAMGIETNDSTVYNYDGAGKLLESLSYLSSPLLPGAQNLTSKWEYTYNALGNIVKMASYSDLGTGNLNLVATYSLSYDDQVNPVNMEAESFLTGRPEHASRNNVVGFEFNSETNPTHSFTISTTFQYGTNNKPATSSSTQQPGDKVTNNTYYYQ
jgi:hypothetical protein